MTPTGKFSIDTQLKFGEANSVRLESVKEGCAIIRVNVEPGSMYSVEALARGKNPSMTIRWQKNGVWRALESDTNVEFTPGVVWAPGIEWQMARTFNTVPQNANQCVMLLNGRLEKGETVNYARPAICKIWME